MKHGAQPLDSISHPPTTDVEWEAISKTSKSKCIVVARTWFAARALAMQKLGCGPHEVAVMMRIS